MAPRSREYSLRSRLLVAALAVAVSLLGVECVLRLVWHNSYRSQSAEHYLRLRIQPANRDYEIDRGMLDPRRPVVRLRTDRRSYIRPAFVHRDPDATVVFLGGSTTACIAVAEELRFPALVSTALAKQGLRVNTLNAARDGNTVHDSLNVLVNHVVFDRPDMAVLMNATNDIGIQARPGGYRARGSKPLSLHDVAPWVKHVASGSCYVLALARKSLSRKVREQPLPNAQLRNAPAMAEKMPMEEYRRRLLAFVHLCRDFGIRPVLMTQPLSGTTTQLTPDWADLGAQDRCNAVIRQIGDEEQVLVIDLVDYLQTEVADWEQPMRVFYDGMHVTDEGSRIYARHIASELLPLIRRRGG